MSGELELLAARKQLLQARASLQRLQAVHAIGTLRARTKMPDSLAAVVSDPQLRPLAIAAALFALRRPRLRRVAVVAGIVFFVVRFFRRARS